MQRNEHKQQKKKSAAKRAVRWALAGALSLGSSLTLLGFAPTDGVERNLSALPAIKNWGLVNTQAKSHIQAVDAWKIEDGSRDVIVAVIDTGIDPEHKNLQSNLWQDPAANRVPTAAGAAANSKVFGWNFVVNQPNPRDEHGHGTHVAGIIGAVSDPKSGVSGVAHQVSIMPVKYYSDANPGSVNLRNTVRAIEYAVEKGAKIINYSGGGPEFSEEEYLAIKKAEAKGVLFVAAAGNERQDTDLVENYYYPSAYRLTNILSVAATDINNQLLKSSNWGKHKVDVAAPGENIYSTLPGNRYGYMSGTSQATAFVSGMAALLLAQDPTLTAPQLKELIMNSVDRLPTLANKVATGGRVNAYAALVALRAKKAGPGLPGLLATRPLDLVGALGSGTIAH